DRTTRSPMMSGQRTTFRRFLQVTLLLTTATSLLWASAATAQELPAASLKWIPADAATYSVLLRNREQFDLMVNSRAWAKLTALPAVHMAREKVGDLLAQAGPIAGVQQWFQQPENQALVRLLGEMVSDEVFLYGGRNSPDFVRVLQELQ